MSLTLKVKQDRDVKMIDNGLNNFIIIHNKISISTGLTGAITANALGPSLTFLGHLKVGTNYN